MKTPWDFFQSSRTKIKNTWKIAFLSAFVLGILIHLPVMLSDIPNHDGLSSMYFDQNMITSGRWFLSVACGFSSYFTIPWIIGLIGLLWLALAAVALTELLELADPVGNHGSERIAGFFSGTGIHFCLCVYHGWLYDGTVPRNSGSAFYEKTEKRLAGRGGMSCVQYGDLSGISALCHSAVRICEIGRAHV